MGHIFLLRKFLNWLNGRPIESITSDDLRDYLKLFRDGNPYTYSNILKALRRFFRDFMGMPNLVQSFKFPTRDPPVKRVPSKEE